MESEDWDQEKALEVSCPLHLRGQRCRLGCSSSQSQWAAVLSWNLGLLTPVKVPFYSLCSIKGLNAILYLIEVRQHSRNACFETLHNKYEKLVLFIVSVFLMLKRDSYCNWKEKRKKTKYHSQGGPCTVTLNLPNSHGYQSTACLGKNWLQGKCVPIEFLMPTISLSWALHGLP